MPRSLMPSHSQVEMLLESLEERRWLATGHARTSHARDRTRRAWQEIAAKLNSDWNGCDKTWQQWSKYWKDKKSAVRRKANQVRTASQQVGDDALDDGEGLYLSPIEEKIVELYGGEQFVTGDRELENDLLHPSPNESGPGNSLSPTVPEASDPVVLSIQVVKEEEDINEETEAIPQNHVQLLLEEFDTGGTPNTAQSTLSEPDIQPGPSGHTESMPNQPDTEMIEGESQPAVPHRSNAPNGTSSPRKRRLVKVRRRRLQRSPPQQRQSEMARLTKRFIAIEERRLENERLVINNQRKMLETFKEISESWSRQTQALQDLCASIRRGT